MNSARDGRGWPAYLPGGRMRTSTFVLILAFLATWWLYETYQPAPEPPPQVPASEVVPPGFIPDPAYTWAPRTDVMRETPTSTPTTTPTTTPTSPTSGEPTPSTSADSPPPESPGAPTTTPTSPVLSPGASPTASPSAAPSPPSPTPSPPSSPVPTP